MKNEKLKISGFVLVIIIVFTGFLYAANMHLVVGGLNNPLEDLRYSDGDIQPVIISDSNAMYYKIKNFDSYRDLTNFLKNNFEKQSYYHWDSFSTRNFGMLASMEFALDDSGGKVVDYSNTNVQVAGVDEPDIVKTDGAYLYIVSGNKVIIVKAYPAEDASIICNITVNNTLTIRNIFINGTRLVIFAESYNYPIYDDPFILENGFSTGLIVPRWYSSPDTYIKIFDLTDITNPELKKDIVLGGSFSSARLIGDYVYVISTQYSYDIRYFEDNQTVVPLIMVNGELMNVSLTDIFYVDIPEKSSTLTNILSVNIRDDAEEIHAKIFLLGNSQTLYVSKNNIFVTYSTQYYDYNMLKKIVDEVLASVLPESIRSQIEVVKTFNLSEYQKKTITEWILQNYTTSLSKEQKNALAKEVLRRVERTVIHRISVNNGDIQYEAQGTVPGFVQNQFSFSEYNGYLRVSTTMEGWMIASFISSVETQNNVYVLDMNLTIVGSLEDLASGERIYATRFIGDKCYLVTFRQIDPFFVIDLSDPANPTVLGELKIPGFSTYLHPYDETHVIGIGRDGHKVKISLFDVSNMSNPVELANYVIETNESWWWTESSALYEHKAFLFDKEKNLLVIPVGTYYKQSAYVFDISVDGGIKLKGIVTHDLKVQSKENSGGPGGAPMDEYYYRYDPGSSIQRTLFIDDVLYTISDRMVKMNSLEDLSEINSVNLG